MNYTEKENITIETHYIISKILDGDSLIVKNQFTKAEKEIRLYGIDSPEIKKCRKHLQDERESHVAGQLLIYLGRLSLNYLLQIAPVATSCTLAIEQQNSTDVYGRTLAYVYLPDGSCVNELMIAEGYAKPFNKYSCSQLPSYQEINNLARGEKKGLYSLVNNF